MTFIPKEKWNKLLNKELIVFIILFLSISVQSFALSASASFARFNSSQGTYIELYLHIIGKSVVFVQDSLTMKYKASIEVNLQMTNGKEILSFQKYNLNSPETTQIIDFIDLKRLPLPFGATELKIEISDLNEVTNQFAIDLNISEPLINQESVLSDLQLLASCQPKKQESLLVKNEFEYEVLPFNLYHDKYHQLIFYQEIYGVNALPNEFYISIILKQDYFEEAGEIVVKKHKRFSKKDIIPVLEYLDLSELVSGNYHLLVELYDMSKKMLTSRHVNFIRQNTAFDEKFRKSYNRSFENSFAQKIDSNDLVEILRYHTPLAEGHYSSILKTLIENEDEISMRHFVFTFWKDKNPRKPESEFLKYLHAVHEANDLFHNNVGKGFSTDRGYIYLKYGPPDDILTVEQEPSAPPYEIWKYNFLEKTSETGVKFLFYNPSLANNNFELLHSNSKYEINNPRWEIILYKNAPNDHIGNTVDGTRVEDNWNRNARRYFEEF